MRAGKTASKSSSSLDCCDMGSLRDGLRFGGAAAGGGAGGDAGGAASGDSEPRRVRAGGKAHSCCSRRAISSSVCRQGRARLNGTGQNHERQFAI